MLLGTEHLHLNANTVTKPLKLVRDVSAMWSFVLDQLVELWNPSDFDETVSICISLCVCVCVAGPKAGMKMNCNYSLCLFDADGCWWHCCEAVARRRVVFTVCGCVPLHEPSIILFCLYFFFIFFVFTHRHLQFYVTVCMHLYEIVISFKCHCIYL